MSVSYFCIKTLEANSVITGLIIFAIKFINFTSLKLICQTPTINLGFVINNKSRNFRVIIGYDCKISHLLHRELKITKMGIS